MHWQACHSLSIKVDPNRYGLTHTHLYYERTSFLKAGKRGVYANLLHTPSRSDAYAVSINNNNKQTTQDTTGRKQNDQT